MIKALAIKELRESLGVAAIAVLGMTWAVAGLMGASFFPGISNYFNIYSGQSGMAFMGASFYVYSALFIGGLAVALGLKQSAWEHSRGTYYYLLHRPVSRRLIFGTKIVVGVVLILFVLAGAILCYAFWAAAPGSQAAPFEWSMTLGAWKLALVFPLVYLGAFLSGLRQSRWFGTRLVPLAGAVLWAFFIFMAPAWWLVLPATLIGYGCVLVTTTYYIHTRDF